MPTLTLKMPELLSAKLDRRARQRGVSKSAITREALERALADVDGNTISEPLTSFDLMKNGAGCCKAESMDLSTNPEHLAGFGR